MEGTAIETRVDMSAPAGIVLGLRANWRQFALLVLINAFVGAMVGMERSVLPLLAEAEFGLVSTTVTLAFLVSFGFVKAGTNFLAGHLAGRYGRKPLLVAGWLVGLLVPVLIIAAPAWSWIVVANVLLGINQGLCWSTTIIMKIDLVGPARRGLAMGLNEFAGYMAVALAALATGYLAATYGLRPQPFYLGLGIALAGLLLSLVFVRETRPYAELEAKLHHPARSEPPPGLRTVFWRVSFGDRTLFSINQAGLVNNLNDGLAWGLLPLYFAAAGLGVEQIGLLAATYPGVWGIGQLATGALSDVWGRRGLIAGGMLLQGGALALLLAPVGFLGWLGGANFLGVGTAMVYPTLLAAIGDIAHPSWRAAAVGVYRLWRDSGYAFGALLAGLVADRLGLGPAIGVVAGLTFLSGVVVFMAMRETRTRP